VVTMIALPRDPPWLRDSPTDMHNPVNPEDARYETLHYTVAGPPLPIMEDDTTPVYDDEENGRFLFLVPVKEDMQHSRPHIQRARKLDGLVKDGPWRLFLRVIGNCLRGGVEDGPWMIPVGVPYWAGTPSKEHQTKAAIRKACESIAEGTILRPWVAGIPWRDTRPSISRTT